MIRSARRAALALSVLFLVACEKKPPPKDPELVALREKLAEVEADLTANTHRLAELEAALAELKAPPSAAPAPVAPTTPDAARATRLLALSAVFEASLPHLDHELRIQLSDVLDDYGHAKDPAALCSLLRDRYLERYGDDAAEAQLVRAFGAELGAQVFNRALCEGDPVPRGLSPPTSVELARAFTERIEADAAGWARILDLRVDEVVDETGHLRDLGRIAKRAHDVLEQKREPWRHEIALFGNELGTAVHFDRVGR